MAERLFQVAQDDYVRGDLTEAERQLKRVLDINPNHLKGRVLLGQLLHENERLDEAIALLEEVYAYDDRSARPSLVQALLKLAEIQKEDETVQLATFERVLAITPQQRVAQAGRAAILERQHKRLLVQKTHEAEQAERQEQWSEAIEIYEALLQEFPNDLSLQQKLAAAQVEIKLQQQYNEAHGAIEAQSFKTAIPLLVEVITVEPSYKNAVQFLLKAIGREDRLIVTPIVKTKNGGK
jgi:tetratricopeptide (TPR) repeat protein